MNYYNLAQYFTEISVKYNKKIVVQPEYLGETPNHPFLQMDSRQFMVIGGDPEDRRHVIECYQKAYNANVRIRQVTRLEAVEVDVVY